MRIKSYFAGAVEDAMDAARRELGPEAMLVHSRRTPPETQHLGDYEVVFASARPGPDGAGAGEQAAGPEVPERLSAELAELRRQLEGMRRTLSCTAMSAPPWLGSSADASEAYASLTVAGVAPEVAREMAHAAEARAAAEDPAAGGTNGRHLWRALIAEMESRFAVDPSLGLSDAPPHTVAMVGPPGSGKTTTLAKLAVQYGLAARRRVQLLSIDNFRVAGSEPLRAYAAILGVAFQALETLTALEQALEESHAKDLILIDTPGYGFSDLDDARELAKFLSCRRATRVHLVLPASMKPVDLSRVIDAFEVFHPDHLLFTRLDETVSFGPLLGEAARTAKSLSFFSTGQRIPEDLEAADKGRLIERILAGRLTEARSAA
jgi:flagellar biosynthesis protein FlhF